MARPEIERLYREADRERRNLGGNGNRTGWALYAVGAFFVFAAIVITMFFDVAVAYAPVPVTPDWARIRSVYADQLTFSQ